MATTAAQPSVRLPITDIGPRLRGAMLVGGLTLIAAATAALARAATGHAPTPAVAKQMAVIIHLVAVLPAVPLGLAILLGRKGDRRHRLLGKLWMLLMLTGALSALFIRHLNGGQFSLLHLFVPLTIISMILAIVAARRGRIAAHRANLARLFLLALILPGMFSFLPGRLMGTWLVG